MPVGLNDEEVEKLNEYFVTEAEKAKSASWISWFTSQFTTSEKTMNEAASGLLNDHSKAMFLMAPDNKFLTFYRLDLHEKELATQIIEDISYDIGQVHIGKETRPELDDDRFPDQK